MLNDCLTCNQFDWFIERTIEPIGTIPVGILIKGSIIFFGRKCESQFSMVEDESGTWSFSVEIVMSPIVWAKGLISIYRSIDDTNNGPVAKIDFGKVNITMTTTFLQLSILTKKVAQIAPSLPPPPLPTITHHHQPTSPPPPPPSLWADYIHFHFLKNDQLAFKNLVAIYICIFFTKNKNRIELNRYETL